MGRAVARGVPRRSFSASRIGGFAGLAMMCWLGLTVAEIAREQIAMLPPRPPTPAEVAAATPQAKADWAVVYAGLSKRLPHPPPEVGKVWATRSGRICGLVNHREAGVDSMTPFYTLNKTLVLRDDDERLYFHEWLNCVGDHWVELHEGSERIGFCGSPRARNSVIGQILCN